MNHSSFMNLVRRVWIVQDKRPVVRITGSPTFMCFWSHKHGRKYKEGGGGEAVI